MRKRDVAGQGKPLGQLSKSARQFMAGFKSSVSHVVARSGPAPKLIFDQLEPRMLMSADPVVIDLSALHPAQPTHDVVVRLLNEVVTTGDQTVNIERVQAVDANNPATVLSSQVVPPGSNVTVLTGQGNNKVTLDLSAAPPSTAQPKFSVVGGGGDVTLSVIENSTQPLGWHLDGGGAGHIDGPVQVAFAGVDHLVGHGADTLYGSAADTSWRVDGAGSGAVGATKFDGFGSFAGAAGQNEVFTIASTGSLQGSIDGGGHATIAIAAGATAGWHLDGGGAGHVDGAVQVAFTGVDHLVGGGADTLYGSTTDNNWTIDGAGSGEVGAVSFGGFANLVGAANQNNVFTVTSTGSLAGNIDGGGDGTLVLDVGTTNNFVSDFTGPHSGSETFDGDTINYTGMLPLFNNGTIANINYQISNSATLFGDSVLLYYDSTAGDPKFGDMVLQSLSGAFETTYFTAPTGSLSINVPAITKFDNGGGSGEDTLNIMSLAPNFQASLYVNLLSTSYDPFNDGGNLPSNGPAHDSVIRVTGDLNLHGGSLNLVADNVYVGTVAAQTGSTGTLTTSIGTLQATPGTSQWTANKDYTNVATTTVGNGSGATISVSTDDKGNVTAWLDNTGSGYQIGDVITANNPDGGGTVSLTFRNIATSAHITTSLTGGSAGDINIGEQGTNPADGTALYTGGQGILLGSNASLIAEADPAFSKTKPGKINLSTSDIAYRLVSWPADFTSKNSGIGIDGTTISGGSTKIYTTPENLNFSTPVPPAFPGFSAPLATLLNNIPGHLISAFTGLGASVILRGATAKINVDDATINASGTLDVKATTKVTTQVNAIAAALGGFGSKVSIAVGYGQAFSDVEANIGGTTNITASDSVTVSATGSVSSKTVARASNNLTSTVNPQSVSLAMDFAYTDPTDLASVGSNASITLLPGNVKVLPHCLTLHLTYASSTSLTHCAPQARPL